MDGCLLELLVCATSTYVPCAQRWRLEEAVRSLGLQSLAVNHLPSRCWEWNLGPLKSSEWS